MSDQNSSMFDINSFPEQGINIALAGVGGQGTLVAGKLLGTVAAQLGLDAKVSEVHGMAQRGGSVITYVRIGRCVHSPIIEPGLADFILAFEELEALRWAPLLRVGGTMIINTIRTVPLPVAMGLAVYPDDIVTKLRLAAGHQATIVAFNATDLARQAGSEKAINLTMLGAMSQKCILPQTAFAKAIDTVFAEKLRAVNQQAFTLGATILE
jgi:indolepyruvate ferredoxin oxidoreductase beta subunit